MDVFTCEKCAGKFSSSDALRNHVNAKHFEPPRENQFKKFKRPLLYVILLLVFMGIAWTAYNWIANTPRIGAIGSTHTHHDIKMYIAGRQINFAQPGYQLQAQHVHFEGGDGDVVHVHATGVTLGMFLETLAIKLSENCLEAEGQRYCNEGGRTVKVFLNNEPLEEPAAYVLRNLDRVLISYGSETQEQLQAQLDSVTNKAEIEENRLIADPLAAHEQAELV